MPELPDITVYVEALERRIQGERLQGVRITHPFLLRTFEPTLEDLQGRRVLGVRRVGKRVALELEGGRWLVFHLMIAGRLHWFASGVRLAARKALAYVTFDSGTLTLTEAGSKRRASLYVFASAAALAGHDPGGLEVLEASYEDFRVSLCRENHTLKRSLTDPHTFSGVGNAYSDEILHRAGLSPVALTQKLDGEAIRRLYEATRAVLTEWTERLRAAAAGEFPEKVTAFHAQMAVHGRFGKPCPTCGARVQRIRYAENETNYCPRCQTGGRILADRSLSRLLKDDWPRTIEELEG
ncbi:MAG TPA: DNA-formamidopyrimidine glycosylase family protein [Steroidobacteraceae bacterium]|jgi:formamidopyrimidine-DNA glycosylase